MTSVEIIGTGSYLPGEPITNERLSSVFGRQMIWLAEMLGARTRHFGIDLDRLALTKGQSNAHMATMAARQAIADADIDPQSIDLIVMATATPDYPFPATALFVQEQLGLQGCCVLELRAGCAGMAQAFFDRHPVDSLGHFEAGTPDRQRSDLAVHFSFRQRWWAQ